MRGRWTISARVTQKQAINQYSHDECSLFSLNLLDESGEIRATAFKNESVKFHDLIEVNKVSVVSQRRVNESE